MYGYIWLYALLQVQWVCSEGGEEELTLQDLMHGKLGKVFYHVWDGNGDIVVGNWFKP